MASKSKAKENLKKAKSKKALPDHVYARRLVKGNEEAFGMVETRSPGHIRGQQRIDHEQARESMKKLKGKGKKAVVRK